MSTFNDQVALIDYKALLGYGDDTATVSHSGNGSSRNLNGTDIGYSQLYTLAGNDSITYDASYQYSGSLGAYLGDGDDLIRIINESSSYSNAYLRAYGGAGNDSLFGGLHDDRLYGNDGDDYLVGGAGNDSLYGDCTDYGFYICSTDSYDMHTMGVDTIDGGDGDDFIVGGYGADVISGGAGADIFAFEAEEEFGDLISDFDSSDRILLNNLLLGSSSTSINTDPSKYIKFTQSGSNVLVQLDALGAGSNYETVTTLENYSVNNISYQNIFGFNDQVALIDYKALLGYGDDTATVSHSGNGSSRNLNGTDIGYSQLYTLAGNDSITYDASYQYSGSLGAYLGDGDDLIRIINESSSYSNAYLRAYGGAGNDSLFGGLHDDRLYGNDGDDYLVGGAGNDSLYGDCTDYGFYICSTDSYDMHTMGVDTIDGGDGDDFIVGGYGADVISGGAGADIFAFEAEEEFGDLISDFDSSDRILLNNLLLGSSSTSINTDPSKYIKFTQSGSNVLVQLDALGAGSNYETVTTLENYSVNNISYQNIFGFNDQVALIDYKALLGYGDDTATVSHSGNGSSRNLNGTDIGYSQLYTLAGNDSITYDASYQYSGSLGAYLGDGDDLIRIINESSSYSNAYLRAYGGAGNDSLFGGLHDDRLYGNDGDDYLVGGAGNDSLYGDCTDYGFYICSTDSYDMHTMGVDTIDGGDGDDFIVGGYGADVISGGAGADIFAFEAEEEFGDLISDFDSSDRILLNNLLLGSSSTSINTDPSKYIKFTQSGSNVLVQLDALGAGSNYETVTTLENYSVNNISYQNIMLGAGSDTPSAEVMQDKPLQYLPDLSDGQKIFEVVSGPDWISVSADGTALVGTPSNDDVGEYTVELTFKDLEGVISDGKLLLAVTNANDAPELDQIPTFSIDEDQAFQYQLVANDFDFAVADESLEFIATSLPEWLSITSGGLITGTPNDVDIGLHNITVRVTDAAGAFDETTFDITVKNINDIPQLVLNPNGSSDSWYVAKEEEYYFHQLSVIDDDLSDTHTFGYEIISFDPFGGGYGDFTDPSSPIWFNLNSQTGLITGIADDADNGEYRIRFFVEDAEGERTTSEELSLWVQNVNDPVYLDVNQSSIFFVDRENSYQFQFFDDDLYDSYTFSSVNLPDWLQLDRFSGLLTGVPSVDNIGVFNFDITIIDSAGERDTQSMSIQTTSYQYRLLTSDDDTFYGEDVPDYVETGGGNDRIMSEGGDDYVVVQGAGEVIVDAGSGRDIVEVDPTFVGGLTIINGQENKVEASSLTVVIDKPAWRLKPVSDTATNTDYKITLDGGENETIIKDYFFTDEEGYVTTKDIAIRHIGWEGWDAGYTGMMWESVRGSNQDNQLYSSVYDRDKTDDHVPVVEDGIVYSMSGWVGDDVFHVGGGLNQIYGGTGDDAFHIDLVAQNTSIVGDTEALVNGQYVNPSLKADGLPEYKTFNTDYDDAVYFSFEWPSLINNPNFDANAIEGANNPRYLKDPDSFIKKLGKGHFKVHHKLENGEEINVEMYDVEGAYFSDGEGGLEYHALSTGRPITSDDFGKLTYEKNNVKFWVEHNDADYGGATTIAVVTTTTKTVTDPVTKQRISYEEPTVKWKGLATEADSFVFSDVTINVINVVQTDLTGVPIEDTTVYGTAGIDLIIGDEFDNLIFGGDDNDIIFGGAGNDEIYGEGGDDVLIGGVGKDVLYGDYHEDALKPVEELDSKGKVMNTSELEGDDIIVGGAGVDKIDSGEGQNVAVSGDLSSVILNAELDEMHTFLDYDENDLPV